MIHLVLFCLEKIGCHSTGRFFEGWKAISITHSIDTDGGLHEGGGMSVLLPHCPFATYTMHFLVATC